MLQKATKHLILAQKFINSKVGLVVFVSGTKGDFCRRFVSKVSKETIIFLICYIPAPGLPINLINN